MSQIITKFIAPNAVDDTRLRLQSSGWLRSRNNANTADINILQTNSSDQIVFASLPYYGGSPFATEAYADSAGKLKQSVVAVAASNILLDGSVTSLDGVSLSNGQRVLVAGQSSPSNNGVYVVSSSAWQRDTDLMSAGQFVPGVSVIALNGGTAYGNTLWSNQGFVTTLGTDSISFQLVGSSATAFANRQLSNLSSPTALNVDLLPAATASQSLGSATDAFLDVHSIEYDLNDSSGNVIGSITDSSGAMSIQSMNANALDLTGATGISAVAPAGNISISAGAGSVSLVATGAGNNVVLNPTPGDGGFIDASSSLISNVLNPVSPQDAATKNYVDTAAGNGANKTLSNLTAPTAINQDLLPASPGSNNLGTAASAWNNVAASNFNVENLANNASVGGIANDGGDNILVSSTNSMEINGGSGMSITALAGSAQLAANAGHVELLATGAGNNIVLNPTPGDGGFIDASSSLMSNLLDPVSAQDAATKHYVDNLSNGLSWKQVVNASTTAALPAYSYASNVITASAAGALPAIDGVSLVVGNRLLVMNESGSNQPFNGIYVVTALGDGSNPFVLTRSADANTASELTWATCEVGNDSATNAGIIFRESGDIANLGVDPVTFVEVSAGIAPSYGNGLVNMSNTVSVQAADASIVVAPGGISVQKSATGAIKLASDGIAVQLESSNPSLMINGSNQLGINFNAAGAIASGASGVSVQVDGLTTKINGSNQLEALAPNFAQFTLGSGDITNQYVNLSVLAAAMSVQVVVSGVVQTYGVDYVVNPVAGVSQISFSGDLATGGAAALVAGDVLNISFEYLQ